MASLILERLSWTGGAFLALANTYIIRVSQEQPSHLRRKEFSFCAGNMKALSNVPSPVASFCAELLYFRKPPLVKKNILHFSLEVIFIPSEFSKF
jgi:hypothetical protein